MEKPGLAILCRHNSLSSQQRQKKNSKTLTVKTHPPIFALPNSNGFFTHVAENQN